jgi:RNA polymerase sigma-70 factor (ECF subfamily)
MHLGPDPNVPKPGEASVSDAELVARAAAGDEEAFRTLVNRHMDALRRYADRRLPLRLRARVSVSDVLQEAQIVALERCSDFEDRGPDAFRNWFLGVVERQVRQAVRTHDGTAKRSVRREAPRAQTGSTREFRGREPSPSQAAIAAETAELAETALARLPPDYREILRLTRRENLGIDEAARRMGRSPDAAKKLLSRALLRMAEEFERVRKRVHG